MSADRHLLVFRMRGTRVIVCPETKEAAAVKVDAAHAAMTAVWEHRRTSGIETCSRWPEREHCDQACSGQIAIAPHDTLATAMLARFFEGKSCAICGRPITPVGVGEQRPGLRDAATGTVLSWEEIPPQNIPAVLATHDPVCASCQIAERFRQQFPNLVTERPPRPEQDIYQ